MRPVPVSEALGVELLDFDIKRPCGAAEQSELRGLLCEHHLLLVRGQDVTADDQTRFVGYFGPLHTQSGRDEGDLRHQRDGDGGAGAQDGHGAAHLAPGRHLRAPAGDRHVAVGAGCRAGLGSHPVRQRRACPRAHAR